MAVLVDGGRSILLWLSLSLLAFGGFAGEVRGSTYRTAASVSLFVGGSYGWWLPHKALLRHGSPTQKLEKSTPKNGTSLRSPSSLCGKILGMANDEAIDDNNDEQVAEETSPTSSSSTQNAALLQRAREWARMDPNPVTAAAVRAAILDATTTNEYLHDDDDEASSSLAWSLLARLFPPGEDQRLTFGTAGLRGRMGPGPRHMNDLVVIQTAQGLAQYILVQQQQDDHHDHPQDGGGVVVVIGYDHRACGIHDISSRQLALWTALVFRQMFPAERVLLLDGYVATPLVPFAQRQAQLSQKSHCACWGIMVTASHNPKYDAGYKIYTPDGCQMRSPVDEAVSASIRRNLVPWTDYALVMDEWRNNHLTDDPWHYGLSDPSATTALVDQYFAALKASHLMNAVPPALSSNRSCSDDDNDNSPISPVIELRLAYSAMNGVGHAFVQRAFAVFGLPPLYSYEPQQAPDADFGATPFPNPEERAALDDVLKYAQSNHCSVVLANDPDADRLAVAEQIGDNVSSGVWKVFTGDEIGAILASIMYERSQTALDANSTVPVLCASSVSSKFLRAFAAATSCHYEETPSGFKWIGSTAQRWHASPVPNSNEQKTYKSIFSYEESIGYCCDNVIFDKDGISAAVIVAQLARELYAQNSTLSAYLRQLYATYGEFVSRNGYFQVLDMNRIPAVLQKISQVDKQVMAEPPYYTIAQVCAVRKSLEKPPTQVTLYFENGCVAQFRASGTEPKFKYYFEMAGKPGVARPAVAADLDATMAAVLDILCEPKKNGFVPG